MSDTDRTNLRSLLDAVISKLQYDESYDFENEGEEEVMFIEYRKQLKVLFDAIAQVVRVVAWATESGFVTGTRWGMGHS